jgi:hypothetical protein
LHLKKIAYKPENIIEKRKFGRQIGENNIKREDKEVKIHKNGR